MGLRGRVMPFSGFGHGFKGGGGGGGGLYLWSRDADGCKRWRIKNGGASSQALGT